ncbi:MAG: hypothetical protein AB1Z23_05290 [Eubacteriales bacterium]
MKKIIITLFILLIVVLSSCIVPQPIEGQDNIVIEATSPVMQEVQNNTNLDDVQIPEGYLSSRNFHYLGAFRLPEDGNREQDMFSYGGEAMCYNPANDSLFITGHNWYTYVAEITIPEIIASKNISELNQSIKLYGLTDIKGNLFDKWTMEIPRVGMEIVDNNLFLCFGEHYEEDTSMGTHGYTDLELSAADKVCIVGDYLYATNDYMFAIPDEYTAHLGGNDLLTGRFRDGGWSGMGPSLLALSTADIIDAKNNERIQAVPLIKYDDSFDGDDGKKMNDYSHADSWAGGAFVSCDSGSGILFIGTHGYGATWYGFANGVVYPTDGDENAEYPDVPDYPYDERGWWNDDFRACIAVYSTSDIISVYNGEKSPSDIQPYEFIDITEYMIVDRDETVMQYLGASAYDRANNRLFVLELMADEGKPIVHVFALE